MQQLSKDQALAIAESGVWKNWNSEDVVRFQLFQKRLCMDFSRFHEAVNAVFGRPVFTHEFASSNIDNIINEYLDKTQAPTFDEIINLIPAEKRIIIMK